MTPNRSRAAPKSVWDLVEAVERLIALPQAWMRINQLIRDEASERDIAKAVALDTDLSARLLRIVNSPVYRRASPVETISRAVALVGLQQLRDLAFLTLTRRLFTGIPKDLMDLQSFWQRSVATGIYGTLLGQRQLVLHSERLFVMGMIQDIGLLVLCQYLPEQTREVLFIAADDPELVSPAEADLLGFTHQEVGAALLHRWQLPPSLIEVAAYHHDPQCAQAFPLEVAITHVAGLLAGGDVLDLDRAAVMARIQYPAVELLGLSVEVLADLTARGAEQITQTTLGFLTPVAARR